jgi:hypothetical protein
VNIFFCLLLSFKIDIFQLKTQKMNSKMIVAGLIGGVTSFFTGFLIYGIILDSTMTDLAGSATGVNKETPDMLLLILGSIFWGMTYAYIFDTWAGIKTFSAGAMGGAIVGGLYAAGADFTMLGTTNITTLPGALLDIVAATIMHAIIGGVVGWWLGRGSK